MSPLEPPHSFFLRAAQGWLELGNPREAEAELATLPPHFRNFPDVLETQWSISAQQQQWDLCLEVARRLIEADGQRASGWIHQAYSLRRASSGGLNAAWEALLPAVDKFPREPIIPYNLACYACQMGRLEEARQWLTRAIRMGQSTGSGDAIKAMAARDVDLKPLWSELDAME
jgi:hypothetical protein